MASGSVRRNTLRFSAKALETDTGFGNDVGTSFLSQSSKSLRGALCSASIPADLQRHEIGPGGEVLHLSCLGTGNLPPTPGGLEAQSHNSAAAAGKRPRVRLKGNVVPWSAMLYSCGKRPDAALRMLASALKLPAGSLRSSVALHLPGVSVQHVALPRGLPPDSLVGEAGKMAHDVLRGDVLTSPDTTLALGAAKASAVNQSPLGAGSAARRKARGAEWRNEGHRYSVVLRNLDARQYNNGLIDESIDRLKTHGFLNLFELSSFGLADVRRYEVGAALWAGNWDLAARLLLIMNCGGEEGASTMNAASGAFSAGDLARGLDLLPEHGADGLRSLATNLLRGQPALQALQLSMPVPVWSRYLGAVAKLAFNVAAAARLSELPHYPIVGDLVCDEIGGEPRPISRKERGNYRLCDVVLPLPKRGESVPECPSRLRMESVLRRLVPGTVADARAFPRDVNTSLPRVRRLACLPTDLSYDFVQAESGPVVECDLARLGVDVSQSKHAFDAPGNRRQRGGRRSSAFRDNAFAGLALRLRFSLPRGAFAESLIRDLLRVNPSTFNKGLSRQDEFF